MRRAIQRQPPGISHSEVYLVGQHRPQMLCPAASGQCRGQIHLKMHHQRARRAEQQGAGLRIFNRAPAQREHQRLSAGQPRNRSSLPLAKRSLALAAEQFRNRASGVGLDDVIKVHKIPAQPLRHQGADSGLARAHESGEHDPSRQCAVHSANLG